jgi:hypothetical protein
VWIHILPLLLADGTSGRRHIAWRMLRTAHSADEGGHRSGLRASYPTDGPVLEPSADIHEDHFGGYAGEADCLVWTVLDKLMLDLRCSREVQFFD